MTNYWVLFILMTLSAYICPGETFSEILKNPRTIKSAKYKNIVLEGGGAKGVSYIGAFKALKDLGYYVNGRYTFENITGSSVGCMFGFIIALDITPELLEGLIRETDMARQFFEIDIRHFNGIFNFNFETPNLWTYIKYSYRTFNDVIRLIAAWKAKNSPGFDGGSKIMTWLFSKVVPLSKYKNQISIDTTMQDLYNVTGHNLNCYSSRLRAPQIIRYNYLETPSQNLFEAIYISISLPFVFKPTEDKFGCAVIDGGLYNNFPITYYDFDGVLSESTIGLALNWEIKDGSRKKCKIDASDKFQKNPNSILNYKKISNFDYIVGVLTALINYRDVLLYSTDPRNINRIIYLNSPLTTIEFTASPEKIQLAIRRAYKRTLQFLNKTKSVGHQPKSQAKTLFDVYKDEL